MIDIPDTQIQTAFSAEENDIDIIIMGSGSCVNPSRMFWYTPRKFLMMQKPKLHNGCNYSFYL